MAKQREITRETITPERASKYLSTMDGNRRLRNYQVDYLMDILKNGLWRDYLPPGLAFHEDGSMVNGQHRCWAIVLSGIAAKMTVERGLDDDDVLALDHGVARDYADDAHYVEGGNPNVMVGTLARILVRGHSNRTKTPSTVLMQWYNVYKDAIDFAINLRYSHRVAHTKYMPAICTAVLARAYYSVDHEMLRRFCVILREGEREFEADQAALTLRDAIMLGRLGHTPTEQYTKTEGALRAFIDRRPQRKLVRVEQELFAIPKLPSSANYKVGVQNASRRSMETHGESVRATSKGTQEEGQPA